MLNFDIGYVLSVSTESIEYGYRHVLPRQLNKGTGQAVFVITREPNMGTGQAVFVLPIESNVGTGRAVFVLLRELNMGTGKFVFVLPICRIEYGYRSGRLCTSYM